MTNRSCILAALGLFAVLAAVPAAAQVSGITVSDGRTNNDSPYTLGYSFTATQARQVIGLGYYDDGGDGLIDSHPVGLWDSGGTLLASTTVSSGTGGTLLDSFRYSMLGTPYTLVAGQTYTVGGLAATGNDPWYENATVTQAAGITYVEPEYISGSTLADPTVGAAQTPTTRGYFGGNILLASTAPEPATWALMILGFGIAGTALRRRPLAARPARA